MGACGLADVGATDIGGHVLSAWDAFLEVVSGADLELPSRLPGWSGKDVCIHLGTWSDHDVVASVRASAAAGAVDEGRDQDADNARLVQAHRDASPSEVVAALVRSREGIAAFLASGDGDRLARTPASSAVGPLPVLGLLHAGCYELAVHALDLAPCGAPPPPGSLLDRGVAALLDVTGSLSARAGIEITVTAQTPTGGWQFTSSAAGWTTTPVSPGRLVGTGVRGSAADLLDTSAGRTNLGQLLLTRRLVVSQLPSFMRLAPLVHEVPGLPGGAALRTALAGLGGVTRVLGRLRRG